MKTMRTLLIEALYAHADEGTFNDLNTGSIEALEGLAELLNIDMDKIRSDYHFNNMIEDDALRCRTAFD